MSILSNPSIRSADQATAYTTAILNFLGSREPLGILENTPAALDTAVAGLAREQLACPERDGKWSIAQVLQHLADSDLVWGYRLRMVLAHDRPTLTGYDQDLWATRLRYDEADPAQARLDFGVLRAANLRLLRRLDESGLARVGLHSERGEESVERMIRLYAGHDLAHLAQIERIRGVVTGQSVAL
jgi:hypothetical protein